MALLSGEINARAWQARLEDARRDRLEAIARAWDYYEGRHPRPLVVKPGQVDDNVIVNLARPVVDKGISLLFGKPLEMQLDEDAAAETTTESFLAGVWTANDGPVLLQEVAQNGALAGLAALKVVPRPGDTARPYRLVNLDPANLSIDCADDDIDDIRRYVIEYTCVDPATGSELVKRQEITAQVDAFGQPARWTIQNFVAIGSGGRMMPSGPALDWLYSLPPIVHCKNLPCANSVWGYGDLEDVRLNDAINLIASATRKVLRLHAHPITIAKGVGGGLLSRDAGAFWELQDTEADVFNLEMQSDLSASREFYNTLRTAFYAMGRMPDVSQIGDLGALTNFGLRVLFADALERTSIKRNTYGGLIVRVNRLLCMLDGRGDGINTRLTWPDPLPTNAAEQATTITTKQATGLVSDETLTIELGYDYADEQARLKAERDKRKAEAPKPAPAPAVEDDTDDDQPAPAGALDMLEAMTDAGS